MNAQVKTKLHLWWTWTQIAVRNSAKAKACRFEAIKVCSFESEESARLSYEFQYSMTAIAAAAFAMEALKMELEGAGHTLDESSFTEPDKPTAGFYVGHHIIQAFGLQGDLADLLPGRLNDLFRLRNASVHFKSLVRDGIYPHPSGTHTAYELTLYTAEESLSAVQLVVDVFRACASAVADGKVHDVAAAVASEMGSILAMCEETIKVEGLEGIE